MGALTPPIPRRVLALGLASSSNHENSGSCVTVQVMGARQLCHRGERYESAALGFNYTVSKGPVFAPHGLVQLPKRQARPRAEAGRLDLKEKHKSSWESNRRPKMKSHNEIRKLVNTRDALNGPC